MRPFRVGLPRAVAVIAALTQAACAATDTGGPSARSEISADGGRGPGPGRGAGPGRGPDARRGGGPGPGRGPVEGHPGLACTFGEGPLPEATLAGVHDALVDEWQAETRYDAFARQHGAPFPRLQRAEDRHADVLLRLLAAHHHETPPRPSVEPSAASSAVEACASSIETEKSNVALYDRLLARQLPDDVRCVYRHLRSISADRHIPALQRCAAGGP